MDGLEEGDVVSDVGGGGEAEAADDFLRTHPAVLERWLRQEGPTAERAVADGCDAIFIDTFADYGIAEIRSAVPVPVIASGGVGTLAFGALMYVLRTVPQTLLDFLLTYTAPASGR